MVEVGCLLVKVNMDDDVMGWFSVVGCTANSECPEVSWPGSRVLG